ncbi:hypothetical protein CRG98_010019 [Punica granatum]|uniref:Uncharacterized protein n=1 Tax=Punica granatum TaxID=22663 RepID=A0A2I0KM84_PUNGR|nr:hypothetical protein CRG98_010019 [Punica granatum]
MWREIKFYLNDARQLVPYTQPATELQPPLPAIPCNLHTLLLLDRLRPAPHSRGYFHSRPPSHDPFLPSTPSRLQLLLIGTPSRPATMHISPIFLLLLALIRRSQLPAPSAHHHHRVHSHHLHLLFLWLPLSPLSSPSWSAFTASLFPKLFSLRRYCLNFPEFSESLLFTPLPFGPSRAKSPSVSLSPVHFHP